MYKLSRGIRISKIFEGSARISLEDETVTLDELLTSLRELEELFTSLRELEELEAIKEELLLDPSLELRMTFCDELLMSLRVLEELFTSLRELEERACHELDEVVTIHEELD